MIPLAQITAWRQQAPWVEDADVEQDLIISRAIVDLYNDEHLREVTAFRGGTPLHKIVLAPATRYSDDIDLVYLLNDPIGPVLERIREGLSWIDAKPRYEVREFPKVYFRFVTESGVPRRIKVELATREAFSAPRSVLTSYAVATPYFTGDAMVRTYGLEELLATKLRALYQRKKGRDLY
ncbi:MAG: nucleotidyl transferase AbiEii/AbiGii toxin family protein, partial [Chloroflexota bacterium]